ncbi:MAG: hypothetical protein AAF649_03095 [Verrucomicrobiota bacterium]
MGQERKIIGVMLMRNEEWTARWALESVRDFCDQVYVFDHGSTDATANIMEQCAGEDEGIQFSRIEHSRESHLVLESYAGTPTWIFAVDGDEIYDRKLLQELRPRVLIGEFDDYFKLTGNCLHVERMDSASNQVQGYECPPAKAVTKLYNFNAIDSWTNVPNERLHDGDVVFRAGYSHDSRYHFWQTQNWDDTAMRCLHLCFMTRSPDDNPEVKARANISDVAAGKNSKRSLWKRLTNRANVREMPSAWKEDQYRKGELLDKELSPFLVDSAEVFLQNLNINS